MSDWIKGVIKDARIEITKDDGGTVTVGTATYEVFDSSGTSQQASATASKINNETTAVELYGSVDTSVAAFVIGGYYEVVFTYAIGTETYKSKVHFNLSE